MGACADQVMGAFWGAAPAAPLDVASLRSPTYRVGEIDRDDREQRHLVRSLDPGQIALSSLEHGGKLCIASMRQLFLHF